MAPSGSVVTRVHLAMGMPKGSLEKSEAVSLKQLSPMVLRLRMGGGDGEPWGEKEEDEEKRE